MVIVVNYLTDKYIFTIQKSLHLKSMKMKLVKKIKIEIGNKKYSRAISQNEMVYGMLGYAEVYTDMKSIQVSTLPL